MPAVSPRGVPPPTARRCGRAWGGDAPDRRRAWGGYGATTAISIRRFRARPSSVLLGGAEAAHRDPLRGDLVLDQERAHRLGAAQAALDRALRLLAVVDVALDLDLDRRVRDQHVREGLEQRIRRRADPVGVVEQHRALHPHGGAGQLDAARVDAGHPGLELEARHDRQALEARGRRGRRPGVAEARARVGRPPADLAQQLAELLGGAARGARAIAREVGAERRYDRSADPLALGGDRRALVGLGHGRRGHRRDQDQHWRPGPHEITVASRHEMPRCAEG
jgi:hypothetical protein